MTRVAIITARGGSKRIPRKNIKEFCGEPIISYPIKAALESDLFDEVMVSTEDDEIANIAVKYGANVPFLRSTENADDYAGTAEVLIEVLDEYTSLGLNFRECCCIYPTAPFVNVEKLKASLQLFEEGKYDSLFPVAQFSSPMQRSLKIDNGGKVSMFFPENLDKRSQDLPPAYYDAGQFYWIVPEILKQKKSLWTNNSGVVIYSPMDVQDIDNIEDWRMAELKYSLAES